MEEELSIDIDIKPIGGFFSIEEKKKPVEEEHKEIISEAFSAFKNNSKKEKSRFESNTDSEYWVCLCFQSREQVEEFLEKSGFGDRDEKYIDGEFVAQKLGIKLPDGPEFSSIRIDSKYMELTS